MKVLSGMSSGAVAVCIGTPFDVTTRRNYKNVFDGLLRISKEEGISKLYSGLAPNVLRGMSMNAGMLACYDQVKLAYFVSS
jgi:solute carrier family 25 oxoglutarate transporter 11